MVVHLLQEELQKKLSSTQMLEEVEEEVEEADLEAVVEIRIYSKLKKTNPMEEDVVIPLEQNVKLSADIGDEIEDPTMFRRIVGSLIYMTVTRPDLSYVVGLVSQFMQMPRKHAY